MKLNKLAYLKTTEETKGVDMKHLIVLSSILSILMVLLLTLPFLNADTAFKLGGIYTYNRISTNNSGISMVHT